MLVLGRKRNEEIVIDGGRIVISVVRIEGERVRLGITAPRDMLVNRREVQDQLDAVSEPIETVWGKVKVKPEVA